MKSDTEWLQAPFRAYKAGPVSYKLEHARGLGKQIRERLEAKGEYRLECDLINRQEETGPIGYEAFAAEIDGSFGLTTEQIDFVVEKGMAMEVVVFGEKNGQQARVALPPELIGKFSYFLLDVFGMYYQAKFQV